MVQQSTTTGNMIGIFDRHLFNTVVINWRTESFERPSGSKSEVNQAGRIDFHLVAVTNFTSRWDCANLMSSRLQAWCTVVIVHAHWIQGTSTKDTLEINGWPHCHSHSKGLYWSATARLWLLHPSELEQRIIGPTSILSRRPGTRSPQIGYNWRSC